LEEQQPFYFWDDDAVNKLKRSPAKKIRSIPTCIIIPIAVYIQVFFNGMIN
jgi:hypothetical protein